MITHSILLPDGLKWRFFAIGFVQQIPRTETHEGGAGDDRIRVHHVFRPEGLRHGLLLLFYIVLRDLVEMSADNDAGPPIEAIRD